MTFLGDLENRPLALKPRDGLVPSNLFLGLGRWPLELLVFDARTKPTTAQLRGLWKERAAGRPTPILVVAIQDSRAHICGPTGDDPAVLHDVPSEVAERICRIAVSEP